MSKNLLYGKKWYVSEQQKPKRSVERMFNESDVILKLNEEDTVIEHYDFYDEMRKMFDMNLLKADKFVKSAEKGFLFKIKEVNDFKIIKWECVQKGRSNIKRGALEEEIDDKKGLIKFKNIKFNLFTNSSYYEESTSKNKVLYKSQKDIKADIESLNEKLTKINEDLFSILDSVYYKFSNKTELREYDWAEKVKKFISSQTEDFEIGTKFNQIKSSIRLNEQLLNYVNCREPKRINDLFDEVSRYLDYYFKNDIEFDEDKIIQYIFGISRVYLNLGFKHEIKIGNKDRSIKTYITHDRHTNNKNKDTIKTEVIKYIYDGGENDTNENTLREKVVECYEKILTVEFKENIKKYDSSRKKELIGQYKEHYIQLWTQGELWSGNKLESTNLIDKYVISHVYSFIKNRIIKYLKNPGLSYECIFSNEEKLKEKCFESIKQNLLEYILYHGKIKHNNLKPNSNEFKEFHALEELIIETMLSINDIAFQMMDFNDKGDIFGSKLIHKNFSNKDVKKLPLHLIDFFNENQLNDNQFPFSYIDKTKDKECVNELFIDDFNKLYDLRSKIIHGVNPLNSKEKGNTETNDALATYLNNDYKKVFELHIESLRLDYNLTKKQKNIINDMKDYNTKNINSFVPSSSKIINRMKALLKIEFSLDKNRREELENVGKYLIQYIYTREIKYENSDFYCFYKDTLINNKNNKSGYEILNDKYERACTNESKGKKGSVKRFQDEILKSFILFYEGKYKELLDYTKHDESIDKVVLNDDNGLIAIENDIVRCYTLIGCMVDKKVLNSLLNRVKSTINWLEKLNKKDENLSKIQNNLILINKLSSYKFDIKYKEISELLENYNKYKKISELIKSITKNGVKWQEVIMDENTFEILEYGDRNNKILYIFAKYSVSDYMNKSLDEIKKDLIVKDKDKVNSFCNEIKNIFVEPLEYSANEFESYIKFMHEFSDHENFANLKKDVYYKTDGVTVEFKKSLYKYSLIDKKLRDIIENKIIVEKFNFTDEEYEVYTDGTIEEKIKKVDLYLTELNALHKNVKSKILISEAVKNGTIKIDGYDNFEDFLSDYKYVSKYKMIKAKLDFSNHYYVYEKLKEVNWNYMKFIIRLDRDTHYFIKGINEILELGIEFKMDKSNPNIILENSDVDKEKFKSLREYFQIDELPETYDDNIRNYISHFYIVRTPFKKSIIEIGKKLEDVLAYRKKYQAGVKNSTLNIFKKEINLEYEKIKKYYDFEKIEFKFTTKKITILELEHWNEEIYESINNFLKYRND
jgi:hypothetical protein